MRVEPKTEQELAELNLIPPGHYQYEVIAAEEKVSEKGNQYIKMQLKVWDANGRERIVFDNIMNAFPHKLRHFAETTGLIAKYEAGNISADDVLHKSGVVELMIRKDKTGKYADRNEVKDYVKESKADLKPVIVDEFSDPIPF